MTRHLAALTLTVLLLASAALSQEAIVRGRCVAVVMLDGVDINLEQVRSGLAWCYTRYLSEAPADIQASYQQAEAEAWEQQRGLWSERDPMPPWEWRKEMRVGH